MNDSAPDHGPIVSGDFLLNLAAPSGGPTLRPSRGLEWQLGLPEATCNAGQTPRELRLGVHIHAFHLPECQQLLDRLHKQLPTCDLLITTDSASKQDCINTLLSEYPDAPWQRRQQVQIVANSGRNIVPLLREGLSFLQGCELALHLHTKRTPHQSFGGEWLGELLDTLVGDEQRVRAVMTAFASHPELGLVMPQPGPTIEPFMNWGADFDIAAVLVRSLWPDRQLNIQAPLIFPPGMMFWFQPKALEPLAGAVNLLRPVPMEPLIPDGTPLHALERLTAHACEVAGFYWAILPCSNELKTTQKWPPPFSVWQAEPDSYSSVVAVLADQHRHLRAVTTELKTSIDTASRECNSLIAIVAERDRAISEATATIEQLKADIQQEKTLRAQCSDEFEQLRQDNSQLQLEHGQLLHDLGSRDQALSEAKAELHQLETNIQQQDILDTQRRRDIEKLRQDNSELRLKIDQLVDHLSSREQALSETNAAMHQLRTNIQQQQLLDAQRNHAMEKLRQDNSGLRIKLDQLLHDLGSRDQALSEANAVIQSLESNLEQCKVKLQIVNRAWTWRLAKRITSIEAYLRRLK